MRIFNKGTKCTIAGCFQWGPQKKKIKLNLIIYMYNTHKMLNEIQ